MPVTTFVLLLLATAAVAGLTIWALAAWGVLTMLPVFLLLALAARWAMQFVSTDDTHA